MRVSRLQPNLSLHLPTWYVATSALDNESEKIVQDALNRASQRSDRTTLIIAHRLSTVRHADRIIVMQKGDIIEEGNHDSLMQLRGVYFNLVEQQSLRRTEAPVTITQRQSRGASISTEIELIQTIDDKEKKPDEEVGAICLRERYNRLLDRVEAEEKRCLGNVEDESTGMVTDCDRLSRLHFQRCCPTSVRCHPE